MKDGKRAVAMFLIIYLTSEQQSELNAPPPRCLFLLGSPRLHCFPHDIIFCPVYFCSPQSMQIKSFDLCTFPATDWTLNLILLLWRCACPAPSLDTGNRARGRPARIHYFLHNMRKQHLNETFVSCQNRAASILSIQIHENGEERKRRSHLTVTKQPVS